MIGLICAMEVEAARLKEAMQNSKTQHISGIEYVEGRLFGQDAVVAVCGVGKVFAAICAQTMLLRYQPDIILNTGVAGTLSDKLRIGDIVIANNVVQHDMDTSPLGDPPGSISGINRVYFPCSEPIIRDMQASIQGLPGLRCEVGVIASGDQFICDAEKKRTISNTFGAIACEMEGAAIGQVCYVNQVDFCVLRAISDGADETSHMDFMEFVAIAAKNSCILLEAFLSNRKAPGIHN